MLKGMAYMLCILVCAMFLPIVSLIGVTFVKELTLDEAVSSPLFIVFTVIGGFISVLMSALEEQTRARSKNQ
jgi:hypothetical protein